MKFSLIYKKVILALIGMVLLIGFIYQFTLVKTIALTNEIVVVQNEIKQFEEQKTLAASKGNKMDVHSLKTGLDKDLQQEVLHIVNSEKENLIKKMFEIEEVKGDDFTIQIQPVLLSGSYYDLLKVVHKLEFSSSKLHLPSVKFYRMRNKKTRREELNMKIYVQKVF